MWNLKKLKLQKHRVEQWLLGTWGGGGSGNLGDAKEYKLATRR